MTTTIDISSPVSNAESSARSYRTRRTPVMSTWEKAYALLPSAEQGKNVETTNQIIEILLPTLKQRAALWERKNTRGRFPSFSNVDDSLSIALETLFGIIKEKPQSQFPTANAFKNYVYTAVQNDWRDASRGKKRKHNRQKSIENLVIDGDPIEEVIPDSASVPYEHPDAIAAHYEHKKSQVLEAIRAGVSGEQRRALEVLIENPGIGAREIAERGGVFY